MTNEPFYVVIGNEKGEYLVARQTIGTKALYRTICRCGKSLEHATLVREALQLHAREGAVAEIERRLHEAMRAKPARRRKT